MFHKFDANFSFVTTQYQLIFINVNIHVNANKHHVDLLLFTQVAFSTGELTKLCPVTCFLPGDYITSNCIHVFACLTSLCNYTYEC